MVNFNIFGSQSSQDYDCCVFVNSIPESIDDSHKLCKHYQLGVENLIAFARLPLKPVNINLAVVTNGQVVDCFKGEITQLNNALLDTYNNHEQFYDLGVSVRLERDKEWKLLNAARTVLSFFSRTEYRTDVKKALKGNLVDKLNALDLVKSAIGTDLGKKDMSDEDVYKVIAFSIGQALCLYRGLEFYTKEDIADEYPLLEAFLFRQVDKYWFDNLVEYLNLFIQLCEGQLETLGRHNEESYKKLKQDLSFYI